MPISRRESRIVRPFAHAAEFEKLLDEVQLQISPNADFSLDANIQIAEHEFSELRLSMKFDVDHTRTVELARLAGIEPNSLCFVISASSDGAKRTEMLKRFRFDEVPSDAIDLIGAKSILISQSRCEISAALAVSQNLPNVPLRPSKLGQWLAKKTFVIAREQSLNGLQPKMLTDEVKTQLSLPKGCLYYVQHISGLTDPDTDIEACLNVWIDEKTMRTISSRSKTRGAIGLQSIILCDVLTDIIRKGQIDLGEDELQWSSPVGKLLVGIGKRSGATKEYLGSLLKRGGDFGKLIAYLQDYSNLATIAVDTMRGTA